MFIHRSIEQLKQPFLRMGAMADEAILNAIESLFERDYAKAQAVVDNDVKLDLLEVEIDEECLKTLALYQPVAEDLRFITSVMKINNELESVGDYAVNIAERAIALSEMREIQMPAQLRVMCKATLKMLHVALDSFVAYDADQAATVRPMDDEVDECNREIIKYAMGVISRDTNMSPQALQLFSVSGHLESVADLATSIAEDVIYMVRGESVRHKRKLEKYTAKFGTHPNQS